MRVHNFAYLVKQGTKNVFSNKLMSFACVGVLIACFLLIGAAVLFILAINNIVAGVENENQVAAFLDDRLSEAQIQVVDLELHNLDNVQEIRFIPKDEALDTLLSDFGEGSELLWGDLQRDNPLPNTYIIRISDSSLFEETVEALRGVDGVMKVNGSPEVARIFVGLKQTVMYAGIAIVAILVVVSVAIITNTIKLTVFSRRKEINIMKYVGATDTFIRLPFLVEGMLIGLVAALIAFLMLGFGYTYLLQWFTENYSEFLGIFLNNAVNFKDVAIYILGGFAAIGCFIGVAGSGFFVRKYLRV